MDIGSHIRKCRLKKGITQEQLAEVLGVSAQAVSRWENNTAYPDITLLPGLAIYFDTTADALVGMDELRREETLRGIHGEINRLVISGQPEAAVALIRDSLKLYPNDSGLLMSLCETLAHQSDDQTAAEEAIGIAERVLQNNDVSMKAKGTTCANLLFLYLRTGRNEQARALIRSLPHIWESREMLMPEAYDGDAYTTELQRAVGKALVYLCGRIDAAADRRYGETPHYIQLGVDFTPTESVEAMLDRIGRFLTAAPTVQ